MINTRSAAAFSICKASCKVASKNSTPPPQTLQTMSGQASPMRPGPEPDSHPAHANCTSTAATISHHSTLKSCIDWFLFHCHCLSGNVQIAVEVAIQLRLEYVCLSFCLPVRPHACCLPARLSGRSCHFYDPSLEVKKVTERKDITVTRLPILLIPLCKAGLNPCVNVLSKHYIHIL